MTWQWQSAQAPVEEVTVDAPERYTLELGPDGQVDVQADCNRRSATSSTATMTLRWIRCAPTIEGISLDATRR